MIAGVNSLEEAFEYVKDKEVREELQYQYEYHVKPRLEEAAKVNEYEDRIDDLESELEDLTTTVEDYESENDDLNERVDELEALVEELKKQGGLRRGENVKSNSLVCPEQRWLLES